MGPNSQTTSAVWVSNALALDDELNFTDTPTSSWFPTQAQFEIPDVQLAGDTPEMYRDQDSVSTFHPNRHNQVHQSSTAEETKEDTIMQETEYPMNEAADISRTSTTQTATINTQLNSQPQGATSLRGRSVTFDPTIQNRSDDLMSRISDNNSRISALESHFSTMSMQFSEAIDEMKRQSVMQTKHNDALSLILSKLFPSTDPNNTGNSIAVAGVPAGEQSFTSSLQANSLNASPEAGGTQSAAGHGS